MKRSATAIWQGPGKTGEGMITSASYALDKSFFTWSSRFEENSGTNPEELLAAAHAGCYSMKLAFLLDKEGFNAELIEVTAEITMETEIINSHLYIRARIAGISNEKFEEITNKAKADCPISKALAIPITMEMSLIGDMVILDI